MTNDADILRRVNAARRGYDRSRCYTTGRLIPYSYASSGRLLGLGPIYNCFTVDIVTRLGFDKEFGFLADEPDKYNFLHELAINEFLFHPGLLSFSLISCFGRE